MWATRGCQTVPSRVLTCRCGNRSSRPLATHHERSTARSRWAHRGTRLVKNALQRVICVALTENLVNDARERCGGVDDHPVFGNVFFRVIHAHSDFPFLWCSAPISWVQCYSLINPPETGVQVDLQDKHAVK